MWQHDVEGVAYFVRINLTAQGQRLMLMMMVIFISPGGWIDVINHSVTGYSDSRTSFMSPGGWIDVNQ